MFCIEELKLVCLCLLLRRWGARLFRGFWQREWWWEKQTETATDPRPGATEEHDETGCVGKFCPIYFTISQPWTGPLLFLHTFETVSFSSNFFFNEFNLHYCSTSSQWWGCLLLTLGDSTNVLLWLVIQLGSEVFEQWQSLWFSLYTPPKLNCDPLGLYILVAPVKELLNAISITWICFICLEVWKIDHNWSVNFLSVTLSKYIWAPENGGALLKIFLCNLLK